MGGDKICDEKYNNVSEIKVNYGNVVSVEEDTNRILTGRLHTIRTQSSSSRIIYHAYRRILHQCLNIDENRFGSLEET